MKKIIIASAIVLASGVTAWSLNKPKPANHITIDARAIQADMAAKNVSGLKQDVGTIQ